jgi:hypothetical protein
VIPFTSGTPNARTRPMKTSAAHSVTIITARPRRGTPPLHFSHGRVEQYRDEPRHEHQQHDVPQPVDQLPGQLGSGDHRDRDQDGPQRDVAPVGGLEQAR